MHKHEMMMTITILIDHMSMYCSIIMYNTKLLNRFERNNLTCLNYDDNCFSTDECDFKVTIVVGM